MVTAAVISTPGSALPFAVVVRCESDIVRREPASTTSEALRLVQRLLAAARADLEAATWTQVSAAG